MNAFTLKIIGMILMVLDHIHSYIPQMPIWFGYLGRACAPIFFFLVVEGFFYTRNKWKYMGRLLGFGLLMLGIDLLLGINNNIFLSLGLGIALLTCIDYGKQTKKYILSTALSLIIGGLMFFTEASIYGLGMVLIFYFLRERKFWMVLIYILFSLFPILEVIGSTQLYSQLFLADYQWMMAFAFPFLLLYNGKKGLSNEFVKWMFYVFYPLHLIIIISIQKFFLV